MSEFIKAQKAIIIGVFAILFLMIALLFRTEISGFLSFVPKIPADIPANTALNGNIGVGFEGEGIPEVTTLPTSDEIGEIAVYDGRDPSEVRPFPDEVKLFNETQKAQLYASIREAGDEVKSDPRLVDTWIILGVRKKIIGDFEGARDAWEYAGLIHPESKIAFANLGELYWRYLRDFGSAEANFRRAVSNAPNASEHYVALSDFFYFSVSEKAGQADDVLLGGLEKNPGNVDFMRALAHHYERSDDFAQALLWWERVGAVEPGNTSVSDTIRKLREKLN